MADNNFYSEKEFKEIRGEIDSIFANELKKYFKYTKSTYKFASEHNFLVVIKVTPLREYRRAKPVDKIELTKTMLDEVKNYIVNNERNFVFTNMTLLNSGSVDFTFQPRQLKLKVDLRRNGS